MTRRIFWKGTSISSNNCVPRRSNVDSASIDIFLEIDTVLVSTFVADDVRTSDEGGDQRFGRCRTHIGAVPFSGLIYDGLHIASGNIGARMRWTVSVNALSNDCFFFYERHDRKLLLLDIVICVSTTVISGYVGHS